MKRNFMFGICLLCAGMALQQPVMADAKETVMDAISDTTDYEENFSKKIKVAIKALDPFAEGYEKAGFLIEGLEVYYKPYSTYLIFFVVEGTTVTVIRVLKDRTYWQAIINRIKKINR